MLLRLKLQINSCEQSYDLALIQWYDFKYQAKNRLFKYDCPHMKSIPMFTIIAIDSIIGPVHIIPRFNKPNEYFINLFMF